MITITTISLLSLALIAIIGFAIINLFLWLLEFLAATAKCLLAYLLSKPHNWKQSYFDIRMLFTRLLLVFSFAMLSPETVVKHQDYVSHYQAKQYKLKHEMLRKFNKKQYK